MRKLPAMPGRARHLLGAGLVVAAAVVTGACTGPTQERETTSAGCDRASTPGSKTVLLRHDGLDRSYDVVVPDTPAGEPVPVVLGFHGFGGSPQEQAAVSGLADRALADGFVAVFPQGSDGDRTSPAYFTLGTTDDASLADDEGLTRAILDDVEADLCVDRLRVFAMGHSNGGMFVSTLACVLGGRIAAVAPVAGVHLLPDCDGRPVPIVVTHGTADPVVPFDGAGIAVPLADLLGDSDAITPQLRMFEPVVERPATSWVEAWAEHNGCSLEAPEVGTIGTAVERTAYGGCDGGADVVLQAVRGAGHSWPTAELDATARALAFFEDHPLPADALDG